MPTPASNTNPSSPPSYSFSTCPDDTQQSSYSNRHSHEPLHGQSDMHIHIQHAHSANAVSPLVIGEPSPPEGLVSDHAMVDDTRGSEAPSSRSATASPQPQSAATAITSPIPSPQDAESSKTQESEIGSQLSRESSGCVRDATEPRLSAPEHARTSPLLDQDQNCVDAQTQEDDLWSPSMGADYSCTRNIPSLSSSYLRSGSKFHGTQQSERQVYDVQVEIKHVDLRESFLCGYLRIQGLTEDHPTLTTYFEGEIIGTKYSFFTQNESWGANSKVDMSHWAKFSAFRPIQKQSRNGRYPIRDVAQRENIFMRWKEHFLVPDHRVRTITGASFEGFYYICFNQVKGEVSGIYFHSKSEKFQQLELKHVPDRGCFAGVEFR